MTRCLLTEREIEILVAYGKLGTQEAVAEHLGISIPTIKMYLRKARKDSGSNSTVQTLYRYMMGELFVYDEE